MRLTYTLATLVTAAGIVVVTEILPPLSERAHAAYGSPDPAIVAVERHYRFTDVGSHGPAYEFVQQGPIRVITPVP